MRYRCATSAWAPLYRAGRTGSERHQASPQPLRCRNSAPSPADDDLPRRLAKFRCVRQDENTAILSRSFGAVADEYNRLRSGPSSEALDWLLPEDATDVLEIGAGTGILTRLLAERVAT